MTRCSGWVGFGLVGGLDGCLVSQAEPRCYDTYSSTTVDMGFLF